MVRVGGGWIALDEFLMKNDPCRGKNIHLVLTFISHLSYKSNISIKAILETFLLTNKLRSIYLQSNTNMELCKLKKTYICKLNSCFSFAFTKSV